MRTKLWSFPRVSGAGPQWTITVVILRWPVPLLRLLLLPLDHAATRAVHDRGGDAAAQAGRRVDQRLQRDQPRGLALSTSRPAQRGFKIASVGNDPKDKTIKDVAHIRYGTEEESAGCSPSTSRARS